MGQTPSGTVPAFCLPTAYARSPMARLSFGVTVLPDPPYTRLVELTKKAEEHGFEYSWTYDSHIL